MKKQITIKGKFTGSVNNFVILEIFRPNGLSNPYSFSKMYQDDFTEIINDLEPDTIYNIDLSGFTASTFDLEITGEFENPNPIIEKFKKAFSPGFLIKTNA